MTEPQDNSRLRQWTVYVCPKCDYSTLSKPEGRPCVRCLDGWPEPVIAAEVCRPAA